MAELLALAKKVFNNRKALEDKQTRESVKVSLADTGREGSDAQELKNIAYGEGVRKQTLEKMDDLIWRGGPISGRIGMHTVDKQATGRKNAQET